MKSRAFAIALSALLLALFLGTAAVYPRLPDPMVSHWNFAGQPDGTMSRFWAAWLIPLLTLGLSALLLLLPRIDPWGKNYQAFAGAYRGLVLALAAFLSAVQAFSLAWNLGYPLPLQRVMPLTVAALFLYIAYLLPQARPNWFVGIRTPWTLTNSRVWERTHRAGAQAFVVMALLIALTAFLPTRAFTPAFLLVILIAPLGLAVYLIVYSYQAYQEEQKKGDQQPPEA